MSNTRDYIMARLATVSRSTEELQDQIGEAIDSFVNLDDDVAYDKQERVDLIQTAIETCDFIRTVLEKASDAATRLDKIGLTMDELDAIGIVDDDDNEEGSVDEDEPVVDQTADA